MIAIYYYDPHFRDKKTKAHRNQINLPKVTKLSWHIDKAESQAAYVFKHQVCLFKIVYYVDNNTLFNQVIFPINT